MGGCARPEGVAGARIVKGENGGGTCVFRYVLMMSREPFKLDVLGVEGGCNGGQASRLFGRSTVK